MTATPTALDRPALPGDATLRCYRSRRHLSAWPAPAASALVLVALGLVAWGGLAVIFVAVARQAVIV